LEYCKHNLKDYVDALIDESDEYNAKQFEEVFKKCCNTAQKMHKN